MALSAYLQCHQPLPVPGITASATVPLSCPALLVKTYQVGACVDSSASERPAWASLGPLTPSVSWGSCALVSVPEARPLCCGACVHLSQFPRSALCTMRLMRACLSPLSSHGFRGPPSVPQGSCALVLAPQACLLLHGA